MIEVYEIFGERIKQAGNKFGMEFESTQRVFIMEEDGEIGVASLALCKGEIEIRHIITTKTPDYFDFLARSILGILRDFAPINIRINRIDEHFRRFGFVEKEGYMTAKNTELDLSGTCTRK